MLALLVFSSLSSAKTSKKRPAIEKVHGQPHKRKDEEARQIMENNETYLFNPTHSPTAKPSHKLTEPDLNPFK
jgi:hypothetical protein